MPCIILYMDDFELFHNALLRLFLSLFRNCRNPRRNVYCLRFLCRVRISLYNKDFKSEMTLKYCIDYDGCVRLSCSFLLEHTHALRFSSLPSAWFAFIIVSGKLDSFAARTHAWAVRFSRWYRERVSTDKTAGYRFSPRRTFYLVSRADSSVSFWSFFEYVYDINWYHNTFQPVDVITL